MECCVNYSNDTTKPNYFKQDLNDLFCALEPDLNNNITTTTETGEGVYLIVIYI